MKTAVIQHDIVWSDAAATRSRLEPMVAEAAAGGARLIVLTEMFATGFSMDPDAVAEPVGGPDRAVADGSGSPARCLAGGFDRSAGLTGRP